MRSIHGMLLFVALALTPTAVVILEPEARGGTIAVINPNGQVNQVNVPSNALVTSFNAFHRASTINSARVLPRSATIAVVSPNGQVNQVNLPNNTLVTNSNGFPQFL